MKVKFMFAWYDFWVGFFWDKKKRALYVFPVPMIGVRIQVFGRRCFVLMKRGLFYRPNSKGYCNNVEDAGRYTEREAVQHIYPHDEPVTMHHVSKFL